MDKVTLLREMGLGPLWRLRDPAPAVPGAPLPAGVGVAVEATAPRGTASTASSVISPSQPPAVTRETGAIAGMGWPELRVAVAACRDCGLCKQRKQAVLGVGDTHADWLFVGEGPGAEEDERGEPFVGQAGKLLDNMLKSIGLRRGEGVYIANTVKCRPPNNRTPTPDETAACFPYLERQIALLQPKLIVALGKPAAQTLLARDTTIASARGRVHAHRGIPLVVTYHPAYLLRNLPDKAKAWEDLVFMRRTMQQLVRDTAPPSLEKP